MIHCDYEGCKAVFDSWDEYFQHYQREHVLNLTMIPVIELDALKESNKLLQEIKEIQHSTIFKLKNERYKFKNKLEAIRRIMSEKPKYPTPVPLHLPPDTGALTKYYEELDEWEATHEKRIGETLDDDSSSSKQKKSQPPKLSDEELEDMKYATHARKHPLDEG